MRINTPFNLSDITPDWSRQVSIPNGATERAVPNRGYIYFDGVNPGNYFGTVNGKTMARNISSTDIRDFKLIIVGVGDKYVGQSYNMSFIPFRGD